VAGTCISLDASCPNGVSDRAPFACGVIDDGLSFSFGGDSYYQQDTVNRLCWTIAQESAHVFGLDHGVPELRPDDVPRRRRAQALPEQGRAVRHQLAGRVHVRRQHAEQRRDADLDPGSSAPTPPVVKILDPANGATVTAGFPLHATATDDGTIDRVELRIDNKLIQTLSTLPFAFNAPADLGNR